MDQTQPRHARPLVGVIELQDANGHVLGHYDYVIPVRLRARDLFTPHGVFTQFAQQPGTGMWIYRYAAALESRPTDPFLRNWRPQE